MSTSTPPPSSLINITVAAGRAATSGTIIQAS
jgi:hypothetical protein